MHWLQKVCLRQLETEDFVPTYSLRWIDEWMSTDWAYQMFYISLIP
jgi:hypothetical protein